MGDIRKIALSDASRSRLESERRGQRVSVPAQNPHSQGSQQQPQFKAKCHRALRRPGYKSHSLKDGEPGFWCKDRRSRAEWKKGEWGHLAVTETVGCSPVCWPLYKTSLETPLGTHPQLCPFQSPPVQSQWHSALTITPALRNDQGVVWQWHTSV